MLELLLYNNINLVLFERCNGLTQLINLLSVFRKVFWNAMPAQIDKELISMIALALRHPKIAKSFV